MFHFIMNYQHQLHQQLHENELECYLFSQLSLTGIAFIFTAVTKKLTKLSSGITAISCMVIVAIKERVCVHLTLKRTLSYRVAAHIRIDLPKGKKAPGRAQRAQTGRNVEGLQNKKIRTKAWVPLKSRGCITGLGTSHLLEVVPRSK